MKKLKNILLVEDDLATNFLHKMLLNELKLVDSINIAENGQEALDYINSCASEDLPELILLDINMPYMDGFEFLENYKGLPAERKTGVIVMMLTTSNNPKDLNKANDFKPTIKGLIEKPLTEEKVKEIWAHYFKD